MEPSNLAQSFTVVHSQAGPKYKMERQEMQTTVTASFADPSATLFENHTPQLADVHQNLSTKAVWCLYNDGWKTVQDNHRHPKYKRGYQYVWEPRRMKYVEYRAVSKPKKTRHSNNDPIETNKEQNPPITKRDASPIPHANPVNQVPIMTENELRWHSIITRWREAPVYHLHARDRAWNCIQLWSRYPVRYISEGSPSGIVREIPKPSTNMAFHPAMLINDADKSSQKSVQVSNMSSIDTTFNFSELPDTIFYGLSNVFVEDVLASWTIQDTITSPDDPFLNFLHIIPASKHEGIADMGIVWPNVSGELIDITKTTFGSTYTQRGCVTYPHVDGYGCSMRLLHLSGAKLWAFWPPTPENLEFIYRNPFVPLTVPEKRMQIFLDNLKGVEIYYIDSSLAFDVGSHVIHACVSITISAHTGIYYWHTSLFDHAQILSESMFSKHAELQSYRQNIQKTRRSEDKHYAQLTVKDQDEMMEIREMEDQWWNVSQEYFSEWKQQMLATELPHWKKIGEEDRPDIIEWANDVTRALKKLQF
ncbi:hypothetical protein D9757_011820 [Collybiopsis confluens]|uniref:JmjC domain-containing protein n=1 Tax=Collybiopsis confluens TaxID=2823264 RepID=A0A8H5H043_9AGAR|nr:hypothetical protein D9757_011820 [Collybiopsis confluens]